MILNASAANGSSSEALRSIGSSVPILTPLIAGDVGRRRQIVDDRVEQRLHALVLERRAAQHRDEGARRSCPCGCSASASRRRAPRRRDRLRAPRRPARPPARPAVRAHSCASSVMSAGMSTTSNFGAERLVAPLERLHLDQIDDADEIALDADRQLQHAAACAPSRSRIIATQRGKSAPMRSILLTKQMRGTPYLSAWRHTVSDCGSTPATESNTATAPSSTRRRALDLDREIDVAGRVDDVDPVVLPEAGRRGRGDRDAAFLLLLHPVHRRGAFVHLADLVGAAGVIEDPLGGRRFAGIDVRHDADVAVPLERRRACHHEYSRAPTERRRSENA